MTPAAPKTPTKDPKAPKPAKKEDCVFEGNAANFQQLVLESKVPVLVDIYADWCGPCKQLGPMLEAAAMKSGRLRVWCGVM
jgi:thioredoxin-like negative regulator of GroEL